jgi:ankyrin repeat protein
LNFKYHDNLQNGALHLAIINKKPPSIISLLCQKGAIVTIKNGENKTPLDLIIETQQSTLLDSIIENVVDNQQLTSAYHALIKLRGSAFVFRSFLRNPTSMPIAITTYLLHEAITETNSEQALALLTSNADPNYFIPQQQSLFLMAIKQGMGEVVQKMLVESTLLPNTLLQAALELLSEVYTINILLLNQIIQKSQGIDWNSLCIPETKNYALHLAIINKKPLEIINSLYQAGADATKENLEGNTPLTLAIESTRWSLVHIFLSKQTNSELFARIKNQLLFKAIMKRDTQSALELLDLHADPHHVQLPDTSKSLLWIAIEQGLDEIVIKMLERNLRQELIEKTILFLLNSNLRLDLVTFILNKDTIHNLNVRSVPDTQNYSLHEAIIHNASHELIALLCKKGAKITSLNRDNKSPLDLALELERFDLVRIMLKNTAMTFTKQQAQQLQTAIGTCLDVYLLFDLKFKIKSDALAQRRHSIFTKNPLITPPEANSPLTWQQFKYVLGRFNKHEHDLIHKFIDKHVACLHLTAELENLIKSHAKACSHYLRETKGIMNGIHQTKASLSFLERILCSNLTDREIIEREAKSYLKGDDLYKATYSIRCSKGSGYGKFSRIAFVYDQGLFKTAPEEKPQRFAQLSKTERKHFTQTVKDSVGWGI